MLGEAGKPRLEVAASNGLRYVLERSDDLRVWSVVTTNAPTDGRLVFEDALSAGVPARDSIACGQRLLLPENAIVPLLHAVVSLYHCGALTDRAVKRRALRPPALIGSVDDLSAMTSTSPIVAWGNHMVGNNAA